MEDAKEGVKKLKEDYLKEQEFHELKKHMCKVF